MNENTILKEYGLRIGELDSGPRNTICDVSGVLVGQCTISDGPVQTGVTALLPHPGNCFRDKVLAACRVLNGFGKSLGLVQVEELGTIETPILLTNTFSVGTVAEATIRHMLGSNPEIGVSTGTVNPLVLECNDGYLNDIRGMHVRGEHVRAALDDASDEFAQGAVGAGRGMSCYELKGGIGSSSRLVPIGDERYHVGVLVLSNFGERGDLVVDGIRVGGRLDAEGRCDESGSVIVVIATDIPLSERQLRRLCLRASVGITRTGSFIGNGSGEIAVAFTTANRVPHFPGERRILPLRSLHDDAINVVFRAVVEATEEAVLCSMLHAEEVTGRGGHRRTSLTSYAHLFRRQNQPVSFRNNLRSSPTSE
jgi:D-aminopeptidase